MRNIFSIFSLILFSIFCIWNVQAQQSPNVNFNKGAYTSAEPINSNAVGQNQTTIKLALLVAQNDSYFGLNRKNPFLCDSGGAITLALERLWREGILPSNLNFSFQWRFEKCDATKAIGYTYDSLQSFGADAIIPTSCIDVPPVIGHLATNFSIPMILWGSSMRKELNDWVTYNTMLNVVPNFKSMSVLLMETMRYFNRTQFAMIIQSDFGVSGSCYQFGTAIDNAKASYPDIQVTYKVRIFNTATTDLSSIVQQIKPRARIILICFDDTSQLRQFSLSLFDNGLNTSDFVYIMPDYDLTLSFNLTLAPFWNQAIWRGNSSIPTDGRDSDAEVIGRLTFWFHYDITLSALSNADYPGFYGRVLTKSQGWPFYCDTSKVTNASIYSMILYDAIYDYGLALNASFNKFGISPDVYRNGTLISTNSRQTFMGMTGRAIIETTGNSRVLVLSNRLSNDNGNRLRVLLQFTLNNGKLNITVQNGPAIWASPFKGFPPLSVPPCGFNGNLCPISPFDAYKGYIISGLTLFLISIIGGIYLFCYIIYSRIRNKEQNNLLWKISFVNLTRIKQKQGERQQCLFLPAALDSALGNNPIEQQANSISTSLGQTERSERSSHSNPSSVSTLGTNNSNGGGNNVALAKGLALYLYNGEKCVGQKHGPSALIQLSEMAMAELRMMRILDHDNLNRFHGLSLDGIEAISVWKFCNRGSIRDMIGSGNAFTKDQVFVQSIVSELCEGLAFLHNSDLKFHGRLRSTCCLVDERWQVKISQFGLCNMKSVKKPKKSDLLWKAPEQLRSVPGDEDFMEGSKQSDIYTLGLIFTEVVNMHPCWEEREEGGTVEGEENSVEETTNRGNQNQNNQQGRRNRRQRQQQRQHQHRQGRNAEEILYLVKRGGLIPLRPTIRPAIDGLDPTLIHLIRECWAEEPAERPTIRQIREAIRTIVRSQRNANLMDHVFNMLEQYATKLEEEVGERTRELAEEKKKSDLLLYRMLPRQIADRLKVGQSVEPEHYDCVTVFFSDVVAFAALSNRMRPLQVVMLMNELYTVFDSIINEHDVYKVESIGDGYLCVSGLPKRNGNQHAKECADMALKFQRSLGTFHVGTALPPGENIRLRIGLHSGSCMAGVVGLSMPRYCLFGDTVNTASRMESTSSPNRIHISNDTYQLLAKHFEGYKMENRGEIIIKGKGVMQTFWLLGHTEIGQVQETMNGANTRMVADL